MKNWKEMTKEEKRDAISDIAVLRGNAKSWNEIAEYYGTSESTIKEAFRVSVKTTENIEKSCKELLEENSVKTTEITKEMFFSFFEKIEKLELELASVNKLEVENASIEVLDESKFKYFLYDSSGKLLRKVENLDELSNEGLNVNWAKERFENGSSELNFKNFVVRNSFKESFDTSKETSIDSSTALKETIKEIIKFCKDEDIETLKNNMENILKRIDD